MGENRFNKKLVKDQKEKIAALESQHTKDQDMLDEYMEAKMNNQSEYD